jgi:hypothetical protein
MSITHGTPVRDGFANDVTAAVDAGTAGNVVLKTGVTTVSTIPLNLPSFGAASSGVITLDVSPVPEDPSAVGNGSAVDSFEFQSSAAAVVFTGDAIPGDMTLSKNPIDAGDTVQITSFTYTASP